MQLGDGEPQRPSDCVTVVCRVRPFAKREIEICDENGTAMRPIIAMENNDTIFLDPESFIEKERFHFDHSLWSVDEDSPHFASQEVVMNKIGSPAIDHVWNGFNTCIFAYGQTGSGKTFTMMGCDEEPGLVPRMCRELFQTVDTKRQKDCGKIVEGTTREYHLEARFMEIYNDKVKDLLWELRSPQDCSDGVDHENLKVRMMPNVGPLIVGLTSVAVDKWEDCLRLIEEGTKHRSVAATKMNATSSRSHSIFRLNFVQTTRILSQRVYEKPKSYDKTSSVCLVDLAGSERNKKTGAQGDRLKEAVAINKSLTALKNVIDALVECRPVIPYRDSQLTFLLWESLGGNSKTFMIACVSPHYDNADETLNTLRYALRAQGIVCHATVNESEELRKMNQMRNELEHLRQLREDPHESFADELRKTQEDKREQLATMQSMAALHQVREQELQRHVALSSELQRNSKYQMAFRVVVAQRIESSCIKRAPLHRLRVEELKHLIRDQEKKLSKLAVLLSASAKGEVDAKSLFKAREKEIESLRARNGALEWRKRSLMKQDEQLRMAAERKMNMKPAVALMTRLLTGFHHYRHQQTFAKAKEKSQQQLQDAEGKELLVSDEISRQNQEIILRCDRECARLEGELASCKEKLLEDQVKYSKKIQGLHAECIFLETELKEATEDHEKSIAVLNKSKAATFFVIKEEWLAKLQKLSANLGKDEEALSKATEDVLEVVRQTSKRELHCMQAEYSATLKSIRERNNDEHEAVVSHCRDEVSKVDALNRESETFLCRHRLHEARYRDVYLHLLSLCDSGCLKKLLLEAGNKAAAVQEANAALAAPLLTSNHSYQTPKREATTPLFSSGGADTPTPQRKVTGPALYQPRGRSPLGARR